MNEEDRWFQKGLVRIQTNKITVEDSMELNWFRSDSRTKNKSFDGMLEYEKEVQELSSSDKWTIISGNTAVINSDMN
jgi:hypothetical protein